MRTAVLTVMCICFSLPLPCAAETIAVDASGAGDYKTIQAGIIAANDGDTVVVADGTYTGAANRNIVFLGKAIAVTSENGPANCIIDCLGASRGFLIDNSEGPDSIIKGFTIMNGLASYGGGIYCAGSSPTIINCVLIGNEALVGGGVSCRNSASPMLKSCIIAGNVCTGIGAGGIDSINAGPAIVNCTIADNSRLANAGGIRLAENSNAIVTNCILWGDSPDEVFVESGSTVSVTYSDVQGFWPGEGNIAADPCFTGWSGVFGKDYRLRGDSPCVDAGDPNYIPEPDETDVYGNSRVIGGIVEIGAYELHPVIEVSAADFVFSTSGLDGENPPGQQLVIRNAGGETLNWHIEHDCDWLTVEPDSGSSDGQPNEVTLSVDTSGLVRGAHECSITILDPNAENSPQIVHVQLLHGPILELSDNFFGFEGSNPPEHFLTIRNAGGGILNWRIDYDCNWLTVEPDSGSSTGEPDEIILSMDMSLLPPTPPIYNCSLTVLDPYAGNSPQLIQVEWVVLRGCFPSTPEYARQYADWIAYGMPDCWCNSQAIVGRPPTRLGDYQCDGDADSRNEGVITKYRVSLIDIIYIIDNWKKKMGDPTLSPCADVDHKAEGVIAKYRVGLNDLNIVIANWKKKDRALPGDCPRPE